MCVLKAFVSHFLAQGGIYEIGCGVTVTVQGGGSSIGADRVCGGGDGPVDIGDMSREWKSSEAKVQDNGYVYDCLEHDTSRSAIQIPVAIDGLTVATSLRGGAQECIEILGGLTVDQLRWIYSSYTMAELESTGWDSSSLKNSDGQDSTHFWSELDSSCPETEILIAGADDLSGTYEYFLETVLADHDNGETFALNRPNGYVNSALDEDLVAYVLDNGNAISYFGYSYYFQNSDTLYAAAVKNGAGRYITPNEQSVGDGSYEPLARRIYMNLHDDMAALEATAPFVKFGMSDEGRELVVSYYVCMDGWCATTSDCSLVSPSFMFGLLDRLFKTGCNRICCSSRRVWCRDNRTIEHRPRNREYFFQQ